MNNPYDPADSFFDPYAEPRLPMGRWNMSALSSPRNGGSVVVNPGSEQARSTSDTEQTGDTQTWNLPKFEEPRTMPKGWDLSSLL
jgi:hypothetical protein